MKNARLRESSSTDECVDTSLDHQVHVVLMLLQLQASKTCCYVVYPLDPPYSDSQDGGLSQRVSDFWMRQKTGTLCHSCEHVLL